MFGSIRRVVGALSGAVARRANHAPDSPPDDVAGQLMSRGRTFRQTAAEAAIPFSTSTPVYPGQTSRGGPRVGPYTSLHPALTPVAASTANSMAASIPSAKPSGARAGAVSTFTLEEEEVGDVGSVSAAPMDEARPARVGDIAEDEEDTVEAAATVQQSLLNTFSRSRRLPTRRSSGCTSTVPDF